MGSATDIGSLLAPSGLSTPIFTLIGNDDFWSCHADFRPKTSPKNGNFEFCWITRRDLCIVEFSNCSDLHFFLFFLGHYIYFPAQLVGGTYYPQQSSGQAVVTGVVPSPPQYVPSFLSCIGFSIPTARRFSSNVATSRSRAFR